MPRGYGRTWLVHGRSTRNCHLVTPLWCASASNNLEVVKSLLDLGANINAASDTGSTPVLHAVFNRNCEMVEYLVRHGADVQKPNNVGETCLMKAAQLGFAKELCQILINNGSELNAQDSSGNLALHHAITSDDSPHKEDVVQLLIDHGSDPYRKNNRGDDAFQIACFERHVTIVQKLLIKCNAVIRHIESTELLGASFVNQYPFNIQRALSCWKTVVEMREIPVYRSVVIKAIQPNPVYLFAKEVNTLEEIETLSHNREFIYMHALMINERILGRHHHRIFPTLLLRSEMYKRDGEHRRCIDILKYALKLQIDRVQQGAIRHLCTQYVQAVHQLCLAFWDAINMGNTLDFEEIFKILETVTNNIEDVTGIVFSEQFEEDKAWTLALMQVLLQLMKLITKLDKNETQQFNFKRIVHRLVRCQPKSHNGQTLLHLSVKQCTSHIAGEFFSNFPSVAVMDVLLQCGANVNAVDDTRTTVLHLCSEAIQHLQVHDDSMKQIVALLLKNDAHVDMVNSSGDSAAKGLTSSFMEMNIQDFVSLKCLAATAVMKYELRYNGNIPFELESFVRMHGI